MPDIFDNAPRFKFSKQEFPGTDWTVSSELRIKVHEFPHAPAGAIEKLGRKTVMVDVHAPFHNTIAAFPGLYPNGLDQLQLLCDGSVTATLVVPTLGGGGKPGSFQAILTKIVRKGSAKTRSGEEVDLSFVEDTSEAFAIQALAASTERPEDNVLELAHQYDIAKKQSDDLKNDTTVGSIFDAIQSTVNAVTGLRDQADQFGGLLEAKLLQLSRLCQQVDKATSFEDPQFARVIDAAKELRYSAEKMRWDLQQRSAQLTSYIVPVEMSLSAISTVLYRTTEKQLELLQLNAIKDARRVRAGTEIHFYPLAA